MTPYQRRLNPFVQRMAEDMQSVYLYTAIRDELCGPIIRTMVDEQTAPEWLLTVPFVQWGRNIKDLANIPDATIHDCLIVDDNPDYIANDQRSQWIAVSKCESPYPDTDRELERVQRLIADRLAVC